MDWFMSKISLFAIVAFWIVSLDLRAGTIDSTCRAICPVSELTQCSDSLGGSNWPIMINQFNAHHPRANSDTHQRSVVGYVIAITVLSLLLLLSCLLCYIYSKRLRDENRILYVQNQELQIDRQGPLPGIQTKVNQTDVPANVWMGELFANLENLMCNEKLYADPNLSRKLLAEKLRTNIVYLSHAVRHFTNGMTIGEYITNIRLKVVADLLINHKEMNINDIAYACGYSSRTTMFRQFRERYAMSPSEYRASAN